jgi:hypothetical protein
MHTLLVGHHDVAGGMPRMADGEDPEAPPEQRVARIGHLDLFDLGLRWVLERGIMLLARSTT